VAIANVELTPPAGREQLYAIWSRVPLSSDNLAWLTRTRATTRDMQRVQASLEELRPEDWHAVLLELDHQGAADR
jgi:hypothetical protein